MRKTFKKPKLELNLIPVTSWWKNARSELSKGRWNEIRKETYRKANYACEICGSKNSRLDCNEKWKFQDNRQILVRLEAICRLCHLTQHYGYATVIGKDLEAFEHLLKINNWTDEQGKIYIQKKFKEWEERSQQKWILDLSIIWYGLI